MEVKVKGFEDYTIDEFGVVRSYKKDKLPLKTFVNNRGYKMVGLWSNGKRYSKTVHRLVAENFLDNPNGYEEINHIDGNKNNNFVGNLEWCSRSENLSHAYKENLKITKEVKMVDAETLEVIKIFNGCGVASSELGFTRYAILNALHHHNKNSNCGIKIVGGRRVYFTR